MATDIGLTVDLVADAIDRTTGIRRRSNAEDDPAAKHADDAARLHTTRSTTIETMVMQ
jgi:hypothetical protein